MRILIISIEPLRSDTNGGNVLSNIFTGVDADFAHIYCSQGEPQNEICKKYFQMTDEMALSSIFSRNAVGRLLSHEMSKSGNSVYNSGKPTVINRTMSGLKRLNLESLRVMRDVVWSLAPWRSARLEGFVSEFSPDLIFAPSYPSYFMNALVRYVHLLTGSPVVSYIWDDSLSFKHYSFSPVFWVNRFFIRKTIVNTSRIYSLIYTMTEEQKRECDSLLKCPVKVLRKSATPRRVENYVVSFNPLRLIFAGNLYAGRIETLKIVARAVRKFNQSEVFFELHIFSSYKPTSQELSIINDGVSTFFHGLVNPNELLNHYHNSDVALHLESLSLKYKLATRVSFSTKITDCLSSGCAVMVVAWSEHSGYKYLNENDAAICVDTPEGVYSALEEIHSNPKLIGKYRQNAYDLCIKNHDPFLVQQMFHDDLSRVATKSIG